MAHGFYGIAYCECVRVQYSMRIFTKGPHRGQGIVTRNVWAQAWVPRFAFQAIPALRADSSPRLSGRRSTFGSKTRFISWVASLGDDVFQAGHSRGSFWRATSSPDRLLRSLALWRHDPEEKRNHVRNGSPDFQENQMVQHATVAERKRRRLSLLIRSTSTLEHPWIETVL